MNALRQADFEVFADYHQFYVWDSGVTPVAPIDWTEEDGANRAKVAENVVVVCPVRNMTVPVRVSLFAAKLEVDLSGVDHAVQASLALRTGQLQVHPCWGDPLLDWSVEPGTYSVLTLFTGLDTISFDGVDGDDAYHVMIWPEASAPLQVLKRW